MKINIYDVGLQTDAQITMKEAITRLNDMRDCNEDFALNNWQISNIFKTLNHQDTPEAIKFDLVKTLSFQVGEIVTRI